MTLARLPDTLQSFLLKRKVNATYIYVWIENDSKYAGNIRRMRPFLDARKIRVELLYFVGYVIKTRFIPVSRDTRVFSWDLLLLVTLIGIWERHYCYLNCYTLNSGKRIRYRRDHPKLVYEKNKQWFPCVYE